MTIFEEEISDGEEEEAKKVRGPLPFGRLMFLSSFFALGQRGITRSGWCRTSVAQRCSTRLETDLWARTEAHEKGD